jgi:hypothetical protein
MCGPVVGILYRKEVLLQIIEDLRVEIELYD